MATTKEKSVAIAKHAKIDNAQRNMFIAVCLASIVLGITAVAAVFLIRTIRFNATVISEKDKVITGYKTIQNNLKSVTEAVSALSDNDNLEVVARQRGDDCGTKRASEEGGAYSLDDIELARTCSSLRVIPDTLPAALNVEATLASFNQLLLWSNGRTGVSINGLSEDSALTAQTISITDGTNQSATGATNTSTANTTNATTSTIHGVGVAVSLNDSASRVRSALDTIETSVRNYDIKTASLVWSGEGDSRKIELSATFSAYYADSVTVSKKKLKVCADYTNKKCTGTTADKSAEVKPVVKTRTTDGEAESEGTE